MNFRDLDPILTHMVSQLTYLWIPLESSRGADHSYMALNASPIDTVLKEYIRENLNQDIQQQKPWVKAFIKKIGHDVDYLYRKTRMHLDLVARNNAAYIPITDPRYPPLLKVIKDPPAALTVMGDECLLMKQMVAIIGSRKASGFAMLETEKIATRLAKRGLIIVSGGAYGCDIAAHQGALNCSTTLPIPTVVVFAGGLGNLYPKGNHRTFAELKEGRAVFLSERLWYAPIRKYDFPVRNRIISGLAHQLLIMQAGLKSGAMVTAKIALDQGRDVLVLRHPRGDIRATGSQQLIDDGAGYFNCSEEIL